MDSIKPKVGAVFLPGDVIVSVADLEKIEDGKCRLGPGIRQTNNNIVAFKCGVLKFKESPLSLWIDTNQKRYVCAKDDTVLGIIAMRGGDAYKVDLGCSQLANLDILAFEGATKRHKPNLKIGDLVFSKLILAHRDMEPEISCIDEGGKANGLGPISGGYVFNVSLGLCRKLLETPKCKVLSSLGKHFPFEIIVGMNGRVWISSKGIIDTIAIANAIISSEFMLDDQIHIMVQQLVSSIAGFRDADESSEDESMDEVQVPVAEDGLIED